MTMINYVGLLGDVHGDWRWLRFALWTFHRNGVDTVYQLGDFGIGYDNDAIGAHAKHFCEKFGITLYVVPGNHDNYDLINKIPVNEDGFQKYRKNVFLIPRGHRWETDGVSFVALGGAPSVDRMWNTGGVFSNEGVPLHKRYWWPEEVPTDAEFEAVANGGYADVMLAHDAPHTPTIDMRIAGNPMGFDKIDLSYAAEYRDKMHATVEAVKPSYFVHGHYHFYAQDVIDWGDGNGTVVTGFADNNNNMSLGVLDLDTQTVLPLGRDHVMQKRRDYGATPQEY